MDVHRRCRLSVSDGELELAGPPAPLRALGQLLRRHAEPFEVAITGGTVVQEVTGGPLLVRLQGATALHFSGGREYLGIIWDGLDGVADHAETADDRGVNRHHHIELLSRGRIPVAELSPIGHCGRLARHVVSDNALISADRCTRRPEKRRSASMESDQRPWLAPAQRHAIGLPEDVTVHDGTVRGTAALPDQSIVSVVIATHAGHLRCDGQHPVTRNVRYRARQAPPPAEAVDLSTITDFGSGEDLVNSACRISILCGLWYLNAVRSCGP